MPASSDRHSIALRRLVRVLRSHGIATARTLEQKISDAGPGQMRVDPHVLGKARQELEQQGVIARRLLGKTPWFHLASALPIDIESRLAELEPIYKALSAGSFGKRLGQTLEIAVYRALLNQTAFHTFGAYLDLDAHDDSTLYSKTEPPSQVGNRSCGDKKLDFMISAGRNLGGIEIKNVREWLYPDRDEVKELINKAITLDIQPILIARRIPYVTFRLLSACGVIVHQTYNQLFPASDLALAEKARQKDLLGYHDIRIGNMPDERMTKFISVNLPKLLIEKRPLFEQSKDLLEPFASGAMPYAEFAARVRRRMEGTNEDNDWEQQDPNDY